MRYTQKYRQSRQEKPSNPARASAAARNHETDLILYMQRTLGNQAVQRLLQAKPDGLETLANAAASGRFGHDFSRSKAVMRMPEPHLQRACACGGRCPKCQKEEPDEEHNRVQTKRVQANEGDLSSTIPLLAGLVQCAPAEKTEAEYKELVKQGKWCRDSEKSGQLHPGQQCYREIPARQGYPSANQVCFDKKTGQFVEESPDFVSAVSGQKEDGTCDIPLGITDPPHPFSQRGRRALGHFAGDILTEDLDIIGRHFGRVSGLAMGIALPKDGLGSPGLGTLVIPAILGFMGGELGSRGLPLLQGLAQKHGFLPTISLGAGSNASLGLGVGLEKRDRPLPLVPVNTYLTFDLDSSLAITDEPGVRSTFLAKVGVRIDPGKQGGLFALGSVGGGLAVGSDVSGVTSKQVGVGYRATDFLDVQVVSETVSGGGEGGGTYWLTLKLVAPQRVLKGHR